MRTSPDRLVATAVGIGPTIRRRPTRGRQGAVGADVPRSPVLGAIALAALGAGLVDLALAPRHAGHAGWAWSLLVLGVLQISWGLAALALGRPPLPRVAAGTLLLAAAGWTLAVAQGVAAPAAGTPMTVADAAVVLLQLVAAGAIGVLVRAAPRRRTTRAPRALAGWALAATLTAALVTPALASTEGGEQAVPSGTDRPTSTPEPEHADRGHAGH